MQPTGALAASTDASRLRRSGETTWEQEVERSQSHRLDPRFDAVPRLLRNLELHGSPLFLLHDRSPAGDLKPMAIVANSQLGQIACGHFAVDRQIEICEIAGAL